MKVNHECTFLLKNNSCLDHTPAYLPGFRLVFDYPGYPLVEPAFANLRQEDNDDDDDEGRNKDIKNKEKDADRANDNKIKEMVVHGVAFAMNKANMNRMDLIEPKEYSKRMVTLIAYDGRKLPGFVYFCENPPPEQPPSRRYLNILLTGIFHYLDWYLLQLNTYHIIEENI